MFRDVTPEMGGLVGKWCNALLYGQLIAIFERYIF
jgi:hypothetical protein